MKRLRNALGVAFFVVLAWAALASRIPGGVSTTVSSNLDAPMTTRTLVPRSTTTTMRVDDLIVIDGEKIFHVPRSQASILYLWMAAHQQTGK